MFCSVLRYLLVNGTLQHPHFPHRLGVHLFPQQHFTDYHRDISRHGGIIGDGHESVHHGLFQRHHPALGSRPLLWTAMVLDGGTVQAVFVAVVEKEGEQIRITYLILLPRCL